MKRTPLFLAALLAINAASCALAETARRDGLLPQLRSAWPAVRESLARGFDTATVGETPPAAELATMDAAMAQAELAPVRAVAWPVLLPWATRGVEAAPYSDGVKVSLRRELARFNEAMQRVAP